MSLTEFRPGGFSSGGLHLYADLMAYLHQKKLAVIILSTPPPNNQGEHDRVERTNALAMGAWWLVSWLISMSIIGALSDWGMRAIGAGRTIRRLSFVCVGGLFVTPLPVPTMFVTLLLPNLVCVLDGLQIYPALSKEYGDFVPAAFALSTLLSTGLAFFLIRKPSRELSFPPLSAD